MPWLLWQLQDGVEIPQRQMYRDIIQHKMTAMIGDEGFHGTVVEEMLIDQWIFWFDILFTDGNTDFFYLASVSIAYMQEKLEEEVFQHSHWVAVTLAAHHHSKCGRASIS